MESLFTKIPLEETINISCDTIFANDAKINNFSRNDFEKLLRMALQNNFFDFDAKIYKRTDGSAIWFRLYYTQSWFIYPNITFTIN